MSGESGMGGISGLTDAEREALTCDCDETTGSAVYCPMHAEMGHLSPDLSADYLLATVARIKADAVAAALAPVERLAEECASSGCIHLNDLWGRIRAALAEGKGGDDRG